MATTRYLYSFAFLIEVVAQCGGMNHTGVITVVIRPSTIFEWPDDTTVESRNDFIVDGDPGQVWDERNTSVVVVENNRLLSFYRKVYTQTSSLVLFLDTHHQQCPINLFRKRILGYITTTRFISKRSCPDQSEVTFGATVPVVVWSFDLSTFVSQFLLSWTVHSKQASYALLFDESGKEHFLAGNNTLAGNIFVFESTFSVYNCTDPVHVVKTAAKTDIEDIVIIATSKCVFHMMRAVSQLRMPSTRFRWLLYPTDAPPGPNLQLCSGLESFCDRIKPLVLVERGKPQDRPLDLETKLLSFANRALEVFTESVSREGQAFNCSLTCSEDCSGCQRLFQLGMNQIRGQDYEIFPNIAHPERRNIVFDIYRLGSAGNIQIGNWSAEQGLDLSRRAYPPNFTDARLTVVVVPEPPFVFKNTTDPKNITYHGYSIDVLKEIARKVGFEYNFAECSPGGYGSVEDGKWTGCIGNVVRGEADVILGALTVTVERDKVMDFTLPYYDFAGIQIMMKREDSSTKLYYYASVFTTPAWLSIFGVLAVTSILLWAFERITQPRPTKASVPSKECYTNRVALSVISSEIPSTKAINSNDSSTPDQNKTSARTDDNNGNNEENLYANSEENIDTNGNGTANLNTNGTGNPNTDDSTTEEPATEVGKSLSRTNKGSGANGARHSYSFGDSLWFVVGALTMAGGGDPPHSLAGRVLVAGFWFFTVIIMSTFTANLAAFRTVSRLGTSVSSLDDLASQKEINYSVVRDTAVMEYFKRMATIERNFYEDWKSMSLKERADQESRAVWDYPLGNKYNAIWKSIERNGVIDSNDHGLAKVKAGGFALITESPLIRYYTGLHCDLEAVGEQFSTRPYAIGMKENFPYTGKFSQALLDLQKDRVLGYLQFKWWSENSECSSEDSNAGLGLYLLSGIFIVAGVGLGLGVLTLGLEHAIVKVRGLKVIRTTGRTK